MVGWRVGDGLGTWGNPLSATTATTPQVPSRAARVISVIMKAMGVAMAHEGVTIGFCIGEFWSIKPPVTFLRIEGINITWYNYFEKNAINYFIV
jgi:hypothetical protein